MYDKGNKKSPPQELDVFPPSRPYLLVHLKEKEEENILIPKHKYLIFLELMVLRLLYNWSANVYNRSVTTHWQTKDDKNGSEGKLVVIFSTKFMLLSNLSGRLT